MPRIHELSSTRCERVFVVGPDGVARLGAANDSASRAQRRRNVAAATSTPDGLAAFIERHGAEEAGHLMHDAMFGPNSTVETPADTPCGRTARSWSRRS